MDTFTRSRQPLNFLPLSHFVVATASFFALVPRQVQGQDLMAMSRYNDNYTALAKDSNRQYTLFPELKAIPLFHSVSSLLSFGGEVREEGVYYTHQNWDATPSGKQTIQSDHPFLLQRYMLHTNLVISKYFRAFAELKSGVENGETTGPRPQIDVDRLDLHQAFADLNFFPRPTTTLTIRAGRQEMNYGASRLISENEGPNVRLAFQGLKLLFKAPAVKLDAFYTRPVSNSTGFFDDQPEKTAKLYGVYSTLALPKKLKSALDLYFIGNTNEHAGYLKGRGKEDRHSFGVRLFSKTATPITYDVEATYQNGTFANETIRAFALLGRINYNFLNDRILQTISLVGQNVSGDKGTPDQLNTFNPLYTRVYYGSGTPYWASNILHVTPSVNMKLAAKFLVEADVHFLWRQNIHDGLYLVVPTRSAFVYNTQTPSKHRFIGAQQDLDLNYQLTRYWFVDAELIYLPATAYISDTGYGRNYLFALLLTKFRF